MTEFINEMVSWSTKDAAGAFSSPLRLPAAGNRQRGTGLLSDVGTKGYYWTSTVTGSIVQLLSFGTSASAWGDYCSYGFSVRCIKD